MDPLREALASHEDLEVIRRLCEGGKVPEGLRADLWKVIQLMCLVSSFSKCYVNIVITRVALALPFIVHKQSPCVSYTTVPPVLISSHTCVHRNAWVSPVVQTPWEAGLVHWTVRTRRPSTPSACNRQVREGGGKWERRGGRRRDRVVLRGGGQRRKG